MDDIRASCLSLISPRVLVVQVLARVHWRSPNFVWELFVIRFAYVEEGRLYGVPVDLRIRNVVHGKVLHLKSLLLIMTTSISEFEVIQIPYLTYIYLWSDRHIVPTRNATLRSEGNNKENEELLWRRYGNFNGNRNHTSVEAWTRSVRQYFSITLGEIIHINDGMKQRVRIKTIEVHSRPKCQKLQASKQVETRHPVMSLTFPTIQNLLSWSSYVNLS